MNPNTIHVYHDPKAADPWTARLGGPDGPTASALTPINALCALTLALQCSNHPFDPSWSPDVATPDPEPTAAGEPA